ncbi:type III secretion protein [Pectobacterium zantedeschiae]|uniref:Type III secretion protein n=1 Tax=Pectobacterium zantedeschiae TaxID=2034769 RepID=A0A9X8P5E6_9GAMM|nr:type III secretion protein [Pectobacterium zantedeschiae]RYC44245.1 type III secretion protein [Pectobacterium zantedeschiae]RYC48533.1 type III secretion protein [Pectobacterium zantedeschiae]
MTTQDQTRGRESDGITPLAWLTWWVTDCLLQADPSWWTGDMMLPDSPQRRDWLYVNAVQLNHYFSLPLVLPPNPHASLMQMGRLDTVQRETVLRLMARVCQPLREPNHADAEAIWCERLAKALRPGLWLPTPVAFSAQSPLAPSVSCYQNALTLLRIRYGEACWPRLRLLFPRDWPRDWGTHCHIPTVSLPTARLNALCDALIWKASTSA